MYIFLRIVSVQFFSRRKDQVSLLTFNLADKIVDQLPATTRAQCDMWCDDSGFEICDPSQFKLTVGLHDGIFRINRLLVKGDQAASTIQRMIDIVTTAIRATAQCEVSIFDITLQPELSTKELERGYRVVTKLEPVVID